MNNGSLPVRDGGAEYVTISTSGELPRGQCIGVKDDGTHHRLPWDSTLADKSDAYSHFILNREDADHLRDNSKTWRSMRNN